MSLVYVVCRCRQRITLSEYHIKQKAYGFKYQTTTFHTQAKIYVESLKCSFYYDYGY